jgi:hypothetical protein
MQDVDTLSHDDGGVAAISPVSLFTAEDVALLRTLLDVAELYGAGRDNEGVPASLSELPFAAMLPRDPDALLNDIHLQLVRGFFFLHHLMQPHSTDGLSLSLSRCSCVCVLGHRH